MPIRWNAYEVSQAMDEVEKLLDLAQVYLDEAKKKAEQARKIPYLPGYMDQYLVDIVLDVERHVERVRADITWVRKHIPQQALRAEQAAGRSLFD